jgi:hypothetical protein
VWCGQLAKVLMMVSHILGHLKTMGIKKCELNITYYNKRVETEENKK